MNYQQNLNLIVHNLRRIQEEGGEGSFVIFEADKQANYYIQFAGQNGDPVLFGEAVENEYIVEGYKLSGEKLHKLSALGWGYEAATGANYSQSWQAAVDSHREDIARIVLQTFEEVYGVDISQPLDVTLVLD